MKVIYRHYEPEQNLEEIRAKIYTTASGLPATADQIRVQALNSDPKLMRFAFTEKDDPLAYISASGSESQPWTIGMGYPWSLHGCPSDVQGKLFKDLISYIKRNEKIQEITTGVAWSSKIAEEQIRFFKEKGFTEKERVFLYALDYDVTEVSGWKLTKDISAFSSRVATSKDVDRLIEVCQADSNVRNAFPTQEAWESYFKDRVLKDGHAVMVFKGDQVVAASAPLRLKPDGIFLRGKEERIIMRFRAVRPGYQDAWKRLLIELAKEIVAAGWTDLPLREAIFFSTNSLTASILAKQKPEVEETQLILSYQPQP
ncbi:MAG: hypothetical protein Q6364_10265 [Candidatus Hermodarchaeota archaeon]|nr:hypothetical protein [Candidatus Hermodarchaeota archaeon]